MRRTLAVSLVAVLMTASTALAADEPAKKPAPSLVAPAATRGGELSAVTFAPRETSLRRPAVLPALYASSAVLQGYDAYSTLSVLKHGGVEQNPLMRGVVKSPAVFVALKAGMATASIMAAEHMWKRNNRVGAILTMVATNSAMAMVAAHNARVLRQVR